MGLIKNINQANAKEKSLQGNAWYSRKVARPISLFITGPFTVLHPDIVGLIMIFVGFLSLPFFAYGSYTSILLGAIILQIHYVLDHVDGNVARVRNMLSLRGKYMDYIPNITVNPLVFISLGYGIFNSGGDFLYLMAGIIAGFFYLAIEPSRLFKYLIIHENNQKSSKRIVLPPVKVKRYLYAIMDFPGIMNILLVLAIFGISKYMLLFYSVLFPLLFFARVFFEFHRWKKIDNDK